MLSHAENARTSTPERKGAGRGTQTAKKTEGFSERNNVRPKEEVSTGGPSRTCMESTISNPALNYLKERREEGSQRHQPTTRSKRNTERLENAMEEDRGGTDPCVA